MVRKQSDVGLVEVVVAGGRSVEAAQDVEQRRLAGAGRPHDGETPPLNIRTALSNSMQRASRLAMDFAL